MSKMDALRAMREAKYAAAQAGTRPSGAVRQAIRTAQPADEGAAGAGGAKGAARKPAKKSAKSVGSVAPDEAQTEATCGHKSMNGRACTREQGHPQKSHRYS